MAETKGCKSCGFPFDPANNKNPDSPYCSMDCFNENHIYECKRCGKKFFEFVLQDFCLDCNKKLGLSPFCFMPEQSDKTDMKEQSDKADKVLKDKNTFFQKIKEKIRMARKARMRTVQMLLCDSCDEVILQPEDGYIVHGNIYVADPDCLGGLIGDNFPSEEGATVDQVTQQVFCKKCFMKALETSPKKILNCI